MSLLLSTEILTINVKNFFNSDIFKTFSHNQHTGKLRMRTENTKSKRTLKGKTQSIETSVIRLTRTKAMPITETQNTPYTPETERPHTSLSRASSLPVNMTAFLRFLVEY
jgi:predicted lipase